MPTPIVILLAAGIALEVLLIGGVFWLLRRAARRMDDPDQTDHHPQGKEHP